MSSMRAKRQTFFYNEEIKRLTELRVTMVPTGQLAAAMAGALAAAGLAHAASFAHDGAHDECVERRQRGGPVRGDGSSNRHLALAFWWSMIFFRKPVSTHSASKDARERAFGQARGRLLRDHAR